MRKVIIDDVRLIFEIILVTVSMSTVLKGESFNNRLLHCLFFGIFLACIFEIWNLKREISQTVNIEEKILQEKLNESENRFDNIFMNNMVGICEIDIDGNISDGNLAAEEISGYKIYELVGKPFINIVVPEEIDKNLQQFAMEKKGEVVNYETQIIHRDGHTVQLVLKAIPIVVNHDVIGIYGIAKNVTIEKQMIERLDYLGMHDVLTGLYNRTYFQHKINYYEGTKNFPIGIVMCDVDGLKIINDTLGHNKGDELLLTAANVIKCCMEDSSIVARIGGDEFAIIIPDTDEIYMRKVYEKIRGCIENYNKSGNELHLSISIGYSYRSSLGTSMIDVMKEADNNMYHEKLYSSQSVRNNIIKTLMKTLEARDIITSDHVERLQETMTIVGKSLKLSESIIINLKLLAQFHDIGKVGIPDKILLKPAKLTPEEFTEMQRHSEIGYRIASSSGEFASISDFILKHHEKWDGSGYPLGIKEKEIPFECRVFTIIDSYDAMVNDRPYHDAISHDMAIKEIIRCSGTQFDPSLVPIVVDILGKINGLS